MVNYQQYSLDNDLYAAFFMSEECSDAIAKIRQRHVREVIGRDGIGDCLSRDGNYDYEAGNLLPRSITADEMTDASYDAICGLADAYASFVREHKNPRNAGRPPLGDEPKGRTTLSIDKRLRDQAKEAKLNLSQLLEEAIKKKLG